MVGVVLCCGGGREWWGLYVVGVVYVVGVGVGGTSGTGSAASGT